MPIAQVYLSDATYEALLAKATKEEKTPTTVLREIADAFVRREGEQ